VQALYDGQGQRVEVQTTLSGVTNTVTYIGTIEEIATHGSNPVTTTTYYYANGQRIALAVNGTFSYLGTDVLGSTELALNSSGQVTAASLYAPYGMTRYGVGTMPTDYGFTGQHADAVIGLDYYGARYYDQQAGQFIGPDSVQPGNGYDPWGLSRYAYVEGNPDTQTDPSGHWGRVLHDGDGCDTGCGGGSGGGGGDNGGWNGGGGSAAGGARAAMGMAARPTAGIRRRPIR
jgi:RHS repeat-associated protein